MWTRRWIWLSFAVALLRLLLLTNVHSNPQFVGLRNQRFKLDTLDHQTYNLLTDTNIQINAEFSELFNGECPPNPDIECFSGVGSYMSAIGVKSGYDRALIVSGVASKGFKEVRVNGISVDVNIAKNYGLVSINSSYVATIQAGQFTVELDNSDSFLNIRALHVQQWSKVRSHGLLGQTWMPSASIAGKVDDYAIMSNDIFGDDFVFNRFNATDDDIAKAQSSLYINKVDVDAGSERDDDDTSGVDNDRVYNDRIEGDISNNKNTDDE